MKKASNYIFFNGISFSFLLLGLAGCIGGRMQPMHDFNQALLQSSVSQREPSLAFRWLVSLVNYQGKDKVQLIDLRSRRIVPLLGLNRPDAQPISVSISANGDILALVRQRDDRTELLIYRRKIGTSQRIEINPKGIPRKVTLDGSGRVLAVQVSRDGRWDVDLIRI